MVCSVTGNRRGPVKRRPIPPLLASVAYAVLISVLMIAARVTTPGILSTLPLHGVVIAVFFGSWYLALWLLKDARRDSPREPPADDRHDV